MRRLTDGDRDVIREAEADARAFEEAAYNSREAEMEEEWADIIEGCAIEAMISASLALLPDADDDDDDLPPW